MPPVGFEPIIPAGGRPHTYALDRTATGIGELTLDYLEILYFQSFGTLPEDWMFVRRWRPNPWLIVLLSTHSLDVKKTTVRDILPTHKDKNNAERDRKFFVALKQYDTW